MREIDDHDEMVALCDGDTLALWAAQGRGGASRAWLSDDGRGLAVAGSRISRHDRLAVLGPAESVVPLVRKVLPELGATYRPLGDPAVITAIVSGVPDLVTGKSFGWMHTVDPNPRPATTPPGGTEGGTAGDGPVRWLEDTELGEATSLLEEVFPKSNAMPGVPGVECWAGIRDGGGRLVALAALAWSAPSVGLVAGVAVRSGAQGRGLGRKVCRFVIDAALDRHGSAGLMVDEWNTAAIRLYQGLGLRYRPVLAAHAPP
jgi:GNAT superfamily N-acetyltransferase